jgi:hypothetical protein
MGRAAPTVQAKVLRRRWKGLGKADRVSGMEEAALALFTNPPVSAAGGRRLVGACMTIEPRSHKHIVWSHGVPKASGGLRSKSYPLLVLQEGGSRTQQQGGGRVARLTVPCHVLVAWLFHGAPGMVEHKDKLVQATMVCHHDQPPAQLPTSLEWENNEAQNFAAGHRLVPQLGRCLAKGCVNPLCLHWSIHEQNAKTGRAGWQQASRKSRNRQPVVPESSEELESSEGEGE